MKTFLLFPALLLAGIVSAQTYTSTAGLAAKFTGSASTRLESATGISALQPASAITVEAWINASCCQTTLNTIASFGDGTNNSYVLSIGANGPQLVLRNGASSTYTIRRTYKYDALETNRNYHIAATWNNATQTAVLYINGFKYYETSAVPSFNIVYGTNSKLVAGATSGLTQPFNGSIDELHVWNTALSQAEIRSHLNSTLAGNEAGLVAGYSFNEAANAVADTDVSNTGAALSYINFTAANKVNSFAPIPSKVPYYTAMIQNTNWDIQQTLADGITWKYKIYDTLFDNKVSVNILDIDLAVADIDFQIPNLPANTSGSLGKMKTSEFMRKHGAIAAINGSYYMTSSPYGAAVYTRENGTVTFNTNRQHGVGYADEKALAFNSNNTTGIQLIDRPLANQNQWLPSFASGWNGFNGYENVMTSGPGLLTANAYSYEFVPMDTSHEGPSGRSAWSWHMSAYPFTAIGRTGNNHIILAVGDGKMASSGGPAGISCADLPYFMKALGCADAMKMDGGGSSTMTIEGKTYNDVVSYPSDNGLFDHEGERANVNALIVVPKVKRGAGSALTFDGANNKVVVPDSVIGNPSGDFSIEGWTRLSAGANGTDELVNKNENATIRKGYYIEFNNSTAKLIAGMAQANNSWASVTTATLPWQAGQWHHFAMTYNATSDTLKLYIDGVYAGRSYVNTPVFSNKSLCFGGSEYYTANGFTGAMDEIRIWTKELSATEIAANMHRNADTAAANLAAYYKFDDFYIGTVKDYSNHGKTGSATGGMTLLNIVASYAPIAGKKFDNLTNLRANWWSYNSSADSSLTVYAPFAAENKYLLHGATSATGDTTLGVPPGISKRLNRLWLLDKAGETTETISLSFTADQLGVAGIDTTKQYYLLYSTDGNSFTALNTLPVYLGGQTISFTGIAISEGWYTIGYQSIQQSTLPGNYAYNFTGGTDVVKMSNFNNPSGNFSIEAWAKLNAGGSGDDEIINKNENASGRKGFFIEYGHSNSSVPGLKAGIAQTTGNWAIAQYATANWQVGQWHHVTMTYNATSKTIKLYQDGEQVATATLVQDTAIYSTRPFAIGGSDYYTANGLNGGIDEVRFWDKELSQAEIRAYMHLQVATNATGLRAYYKMDSLNSGNIVPNAVTNGVAGVAASSVSSSNLVISYAPVEMNPLSSFIHYQANWYGDNTRYASGLAMQSSYNAEPAFVLHASNGQNGIVSMGSNSRTSRVWYVHKQGIGQTTLNLGFVRDSLGASLDTVQKVYLLRSDDNSSFSKIDSVLLSISADTIHFALTDTVNAYLSLGLVQNSVSLPVTLLRFNAYRQDDNAIVNWTTASETEVKKYIVQRSADGNNFSDAGIVNAKGTAADYLYTDRNIVQYNTAKLYYRLQSIDHSGSISYSGIATVNMSVSAFASGIFPNPFSDKITINLQLPKESDVAVRLVNMAGATVSQPHYHVPAGASAITLKQLQGLPAGIYQLMISEGGNTQVYQLMKQ